MTLRARLVVDTDSAPPLRAPLTVDELERWEEHGATWLTIDLSDERAVVELCTCHGEPVDRREGDSPELIEYLRAHRARETADWD